MSSSAGFRRPPPPVGGGPPSNSQRPTAPPLPGQGGSSTLSSSWTSSPMMASSKPAAASSAPPPIPASGSGLLSRGSSPGGDGQLPRKPLFHRPPTPGQTRVVKAASSDTADAALGPPMGPNSASAASVVSSSTPTTPRIGRSNSEDTQDSYGGNYSPAGTTSRLHRPRSLPRPPAPRQRNTAAGIGGVSRFRLPPTSSSSTSVTAASTTHTITTPANTPNSSPLVQKTSITTATNQTTPPTTTRTVSPSNDILQASSSFSSSSPPVKVPTQSPTQTSNPPPLPEGWTEATDDTSGRFYYYNAVSGVTTWDRPVVVGALVNDESSSPSLAESESSKMPVTSSSPTTGNETMAREVETTKSAVQPLTNNIMTPVAPAAAAAAVAVAAPPLDAVNDDKNNENSNVEDFSETAYATPPESGAATALSLEAAEVTETIQATTGTTEHDEPEPLLPGWVEAFDTASNCVYYFNSESGETKWERPVNVKINDEPPVVVEQQQQQSPVQPTFITAESSNQSSSWEQEEQSAAVNIVGSNQEHVQSPMDKDATSPLVDSQVADVNVAYDDDEFTDAAAEAVPTSDKLLAPGWVQLTDEATALVYYYNSETGESRWERPELPSHSPPAGKAEEKSLLAAAQQLEEEEDVVAAPPACPDQPEDTCGANEKQPTNEHDQLDACETPAAAAAALPPGWVQATDLTSNLVYYYNSDTDETRWDRPLASGSPSEEVTATSPRWDQPEDSGGDVGAGTPEIASFNESPETTGDTEMMSPGSMTSNEPLTEATYSPEEGPPMPATESLKDTITSQGISDSSSQPEATFVPGTEYNNESEDFATEPLAHASPDHDEQPTFAVDDGHATISVEQADLPAGWVEVVDPTSLLTYYYNAETNDTTWERPVSEEIQEPPGDDLEPTPQPSLDSSDKQEVSTPGASFDGETMEIAPVEGSATSSDKQEVSTPGVSFDGETMEIAPVEGSATPQEHVDRTESSPQPPSELPPQWAEVIDTASQQVYYYNSETGETRWAPPTPVQGESGPSMVEPSQSEDFCDAEEIGPSEETSTLSENPATMALDATLPESVVGVEEQTEDLTTPSPAAAENAGWTEVIDAASQQVYYYNSETGESRWDPPESAGTPEHEAPAVTQDSDDPSSSQTEEFQDAADARLQDGTSPIPEDSPESLDATASDSAMPAPAPEEKAGLPFGWTEVIDTASQQVYYYNSETGETSWTPPTGESGTPPSPFETNALGQSEDFCDTTEIEPSEETAALPEHPESMATTLPSPESTAGVAEQSPAPEETVGLAPGWEMVIDPSSNRTYYFNNETGECRWDPPAEAAAPAFQEHDEPSASQPEEYLAVSEAVQDETPLVRDEQPEASESTSVADKVDDPAISSPPSEEMAGLPPGWEEVIDPSSNRTYYFNSETEEVRWDPPEVVDSSTHEGAIDSQDIGEGEPSAGQSEFCDAAGAVPDETPLLHEQPEASESTSVADKVGEPAISEPSKLKPGWEEVIDPSSSDVYYYNSATGESQWDAPLLLDEPEQENVKTQDSISQGVEGSGQSALDSGLHDQPPGQVLEDHGWVEVDDPNAELPSGWEKMIDETSGDPYYYNQDTGETSWSIPEAPENEIAEGWVHTKDPNTMKTWKPGKVVATFGFGGRLCMIGSQGCKQGSVVIERTYHLVPKEPLVQAENEKLAAGVVGPLNDANNEKVTSYLAKKAEETPSDILWNLIWIACQSQGRLRSGNVMGDPDSPETAIVNLLLCGSETGNANDGSASAGSQIETVTKDETSLVTIQDLLVRGKRLEAVEEAVRGGHFEIALLVAGMCSREAYQQVARQFVERNLSTGSPLHTVVMSFFCDPRESPTAASALFGSDSSQIVRTWKSHLAAIISNRMPGSNTTVLSLGDALAKAGNHDAAHFCYMVCGHSISSPFRHPDCRWTLVGCKVDPGDTFLSTDTSIVAYARTEAHEWAKRRGNPTATISSLQAFKLVYAHLLADYGFEKAALRYTRSIIDCMAADSSEMSASMRSTYPFGLAAITSDRLGLLRALDELKERLERNCTPQSSEHESKKLTPVEADVDVSFLSAQSQLPDTAQNIDSQPSWNTGAQSQQSGIETFVSIEPQKPRTSVSVPPPQPEAQDSGDGAPAHSTMPLTQFGASPIVQAAPPGKGQAAFMSPSQARTQSVPHPAFQTPVNDQPRMTMGQAKEANQGPPPVSLSTPQMQSGEHKGDKQIRSDANVFHPIAPRSLHSQPPHSEGPDRQQEAVSQLPPLQDHPAITRTPAAVPKLTKVAPPPVSAPPNMQKQSKAEPPSSASKSGMLSGIRSWMTKKLNPDATQADIGEAMTARYDEKLGRWIFPGDDPNEVIPSLGPPPTMPLGGTLAPAPPPAAASNDPLAAMMAPPQRGPRSGSRTNSAMRPPGSSPPTTAPPQFAMFMPPASAKKTSED